MTERTFTAEEVNAALERGGSSLRYSDATNWSGREIRRKFWKWYECPPEFNIAALALGVLPDGWRKNERGSYELIRDGVVWGAVWVNQYKVWFAGDFWPEAVRSGQADIAGRLMAAKVELERREAARKGGAE